ncbi:MAG: hypothetical protein HC825_08590 [Oscillatoriales cyanobacterium RM1_1_9]|nr:hypothetical protein [Oscillatoriales cyanobacterium SM2_3_0]NJO47509.1 hypothetical protein [Oscillatoriales cyanobacterium RM2_1_1]NJO71714.1 hypothetical protein [Oscillatoriales cyanobacterium RM1_1_9]
MQIKGIKRGNTIQLLQEIDLPEGVEIILEVKSSMTISLTERIERLNAIFGAWQNQPDLDEIFAEIDQERHEYRGRKSIDFD